MSKPSCAPYHAACPHSQQNLPEVSHSRARLRKLGSLGCAVRLWVLFLLLGGAHATAWAQPTSPAAARLEYLFLPASGARPDTDSIQGRFAAPAGTERVSVAPRSFAAWLRELPLLPIGSPVLLYDGQQKPRQDVHAAVTSLDVPKRDLQQCADAVMRLRAEYLLALGKPQQIRFHPDPGKPRVLAFAGGSRADFMSYMLRVFSAAGSASLQAELPKVDASTPLQPGDILIQGGYPGHAILVLDVAAGGGRRLLLLGQSYMPAQQFHVLKNTQDPALSPWFDEARLDTKPGLFTPEWWRPFARSDVRHFAKIPGEP